MKNPFKAYRMFTDEIRIYNHKNFYLCKFSCTHMGYSGLCLECIKKLMNEFTKERWQRWLMVEEDIYPRDIQA